MDEPGSEPALCRKPGVLLVFFTAEGRLHRHKPVHEWLLSAARELGLPGGSAFRATAGYGRPGRIIEDRFFELAGELPVQVEFFLAEEDADRFLVHVRDAELDLHYVRSPVEMGFTRPYC